MASSMSRSVILTFLSSLQVQQKYLWKPGLCILHSCVLAFSWKSGWNWVKSIQGCHNISMFMQIYLKAICIQEASIAVTCG